MQQRKLATDLLLLDSCSTVNLISNRDMLHDIHTVDPPLRVRCNAGVRTTNKMGYFGNFPEAVWYNPGGIANIMSMHRVRQHYPIQYYSAIEDAFVVTRGDGVQMRFHPTAKGLYAYCPENNVPYNEAWAFVETVSDRRAKYSRQAYKSATRARQVQNIMMFPATRQYQDVIRHNLIPNMTVDIADIKAAEDIFGTSIPCLLYTSPSPRDLSTSRMPSSA